MPTLLGVGNGCGTGDEFSPRARRDVPWRTMLVFPFALIGPGSGIGVAFAFDPTRLLVNGPELRGVTSSNFLPGPGTQLGDLVMEGFCCNQPAPSPILLPSGFAKVTPWLITSQFDLANKLVEN